MKMRIVHTTMLTGFLVLLLGFNPVWACLNVQDEIRKKAGALITIQDLDQNVLARVLRFMPAADVLRFGMTSWVFIAPMTTIAFWKHWVKARDNDVTGLSVSIFKSVQGLGGTPPCNAPVLISVVIGERSASMALIRAHPFLSPALFLNDHNQRMVECEKNPHGSFYNKRPEVLNLPDSVSVRYALYKNRHAINRALDTKLFNCLSSHSFWMQIEWSDAGRAWFFYHFDFRGVDLKQALSMGMHFEKNTTGERGGYLCLSDIFGSKELRISFYPKDFGLLEQRLARSMGMEDR